MGTKTYERDETQGTITASLGKDLIALLDAHCGRHDITRSQMVRAAIVAALKRAGENMEGVSYAAPSRKRKPAPPEEMGSDLGAPHYGAINVAANSVSIGHNSPVSGLGAPRAKSKPNRGK